MDVKDLKEKIFILREKMTFNLSLFSQSLKKSSRASRCLDVFEHFLLDIIWLQQKQQLISVVAVFGPLCEASALLFGWTELPQQTFLNPFIWKAEKKHHFLCWEDYFFDCFLVLFLIPGKLENTDNSPLMTVNVQNIMLYWLCSENHQLLRERLDEGKV